MLAFDELDTLTDPILGLYEVFIQSVLKEIARRLSRMELSSATAWMMQRLVESGAVYEYTLKELEKLTGLSEKELRLAFLKAGVSATRFDDVIYRAEGLKPLPLNLSPAMTQVLAAGLRKTGGVMRNLTMTTALSAQNLFIDAVDLAYMQVTSGAFDYITAIRNAVQEVADKGVTVIRYPGRVEQLDVAVRRVVLTGIGQTAGELQLTRAKEMGVNLMQVSAHIGARNQGEGPMNHESWQGKVYSIVGETAEYPNLAEVTGLGTVEGLHGVNCRHSMYPFFEGLSEQLYTQKELDEYANKTVVYNGKEMSVYEATQQQRAIERKIREWKRKEGALDAAGLEHERETGKVKEYQAKMRDFIRQMNEQYKAEGIEWYRQGERERVQSPRKTVGMSFFRGQLSTIEQAREIGESADGWEKNEKILKDEYLPKFKLKDDVDRTYGYWEGAEPSFNALVSGKRENVLEMAKAWGKDYKQAGMAVLVPNPQGTGGKSVWAFSRRLSDSEWNKFFSVLDEINNNMVDHPFGYVGVTIKDQRAIECWFTNKDYRDYSQMIINKVLRSAKLSAEVRVQPGFDFVLLEGGGKDY